MLDVLGLGDLTRWRRWAISRRSTPRRCELLARARAARARARLRAADACASRSARAGGRSATAPGGAELIPRRESSSRARAVILYGRNPVREALRGRRRARASRELWATSGAAREPWLARLRVRESAPPRRSSRAAARAPTRGSARRRVAIPTSPPTSCSAGARSPLLVALDQVQDPQNLGSICRTAECAGAAGVVIPERRSAEVTPAVCKASAGAVEQLRVARVRNVADFLASARRRGAGATGRACATGERPLRRPRLRGRRRAGARQRGRGLRPRVAGACDELVALPMRGGWSRSGWRRGRGAAVRDLAESWPRP